MDSSHRTDSVKNLLNFEPCLHLWAHLLSHSGCALYTQVSQSPRFSFCLLINRTTVAMDVSPKISYQEAEGQPLHTKTFGFFFLKKKWASLFLTFVIMFKRRFPPAMGNDLQLNYKKRREGKDKEHRALEGSGPFQLDSVGEDCHRHETVLVFQINVIKL